MKPKVTIMNGTMLTKARRKGRDHCVDCHQPLQVNQKVRVLRGTNKTLYRCMECDKEVKISFLHHFQGPRSRPMMDRKNRIQQLLETIKKEKNGWHRPRLIATLSIQWGVRRQTVEDYLSSLVEADLVTINEEHVKAAETVGETTV